MATSDSDPIVVVGSCNVDYMLTVAPPLPLRPGITVRAETFETVFGGKGANQAVCVAKLGGSVGMVGMVGADSMGVDTKTSFEAAGVHTGGLMVSDTAKTGMAQIVIGGKGDNSIVLALGANIAITPADIESQADRIGAAKVMLVQNEITEAATVAALRIAKAKGVTTLVNPAPVTKDMPPEMMSLADVFAPNESEAEELTGIPVSGKSGAEEACRALLAKGCAAAIITLGAEGVVILKSGDDTPTWVPAPKVAPEDIVDTVGAGDSFMGSLGYFLSEGKTLEDAAARAVRVASMSVQGKGAQGSYPLRAALPDDLFA